MIIFFFNNVIINQRNGGTATFLFSPFLNISNNIVHYTLKKQINSDFMKYQWLFSISCSFISSVGGVL